MDAVLFALALLLFCVAAVHDIKRIALASPREQLLELVRESGGTLDAIEMSRRAGELRWGREALHTLLADGLLKEGWVAPVDTTSSSSAPGRCVVSREATVVLSLPSCPPSSKP